MEKSRDIWTTEDHYHVQDVIDLGRCVYCGKLGHHDVVINGTTYRVCHADVCRGALAELVPELEDATA